MKAWTAAAAALLSAATAAAGTIEIEEPWVRASLGAVPNSAAYMTIRSDAPDRLSEASSPAAARIAVHTTMMHAGVSQMRPVPALEVGPGSPAVLQPGGLHLMLMGLTRRLEEGDTIEVELTFERAGTVEVEVPVRGLIPGRGSGGHSSGGHDSGG